MYILNLKFKSQAIQDLRKNLALESHQLIVINFQICCQIIVSVRARMHTFFIWFIIFFLFWILTYLFFFLFFNTSTYLDPEFHNFSPTNFNLIRKNSQHRIKNRGILILELKTVWRNFKNTMELMYKNLYGSITQIWTQI